MPHSVLLVGFGLGGRVYHAPLILAERGLSLDGIVTSSAERAAQARALAPAAAVYTSLDEALAAGHDLAVITTANIAHVPDAQVCLAAGMHVVLDKPIAPDLATATDLRDRASAAGRHLIPYQNRRWDTDTLTALRVRDSGRLGDVHRLVLRIDRMRPVPKPGWRSSATPEDLGGMLYDLGAHAFDQARVLLGPVVEAYARVRSVRRAGDPDDDVTAVLTHASGAVSIVTVSQAASFGDPRLLMLGTRGALRIIDPDPQEIALAAGVSPGPAGWYGEVGTAELRTNDDDGTPHDELITLVPGDWPGFWRGVVMALDGGSSPVPIDDVLQSVALLDAVRASGLSGQAVRL